MITLVWLVFAMPYFKTIFVLCAVQVHSTLVYYSMLQLSVPSWLPHSKLYMTSWCRTIWLACCHKLCTFSFLSTWMKSFTLSVEVRIVTGLLSFHCKARQTPSLFHLMLPLCSLLAHCFIVLYGIEESPSIFCSSSSCWKHQTKQVLHKCYWCIKIIKI